MAFFKKLFTKNDSSKAPRGFHTLSILAIEKLNANTVKIILSIPPEIKDAFVYIPGQYLDFSIKINDKEQRRSYSICSGINEPLAVAVKEVTKGTVSRWFNHEAKIGDEIFVSEPQGNFTLPDDAKKCVAIAAGSGITPILSIAKEIDRLGNSLKLFYGNRSISTVLFDSELKELSHVKTSYYLSGESHEEHEKGRLNKENFSAIIKAELALLKADYFFVCGPEQLIADVVEVLKMFGVDEDKIKYELFTTPLLLKHEEKIVTTDFSGTSAVTVILDDEKISFDLNANGDSVLEKAIKEGVDAPYSCKGGVCSSCKAKILQGNALMTMNYSLTDAEIEDGYILTCQSHPASTELVISYDDV